MTSSDAYSSRIPAPPQQRGRKSSERIVLAAAELIDRHGARAAEVSVRAIAAAANVSIGAIYHHFSDLDQIITAVAERYMNELMASIAIVQQERDWDDWTEMLDAMITGYVRYFSRRPGLRDLWFDAHASPGAIDVHHHYRARVAEDLRAHFLRVAGRDLGPVTHQVAIAISGSLFELAFRRIPSGDPLVISELRRLLTSHYAEHLSRSGVDER